MAFPTAWAPVALATAAKIVNIFVVRFDSIILKTFDWICFNLLDPTVLVTPEARPVVALTAPQTNPPTAASIWLTKPSTPSARDKNSLKLSSTQFERTTKVTKLTQGVFEEAAQTLKSGQVSNG